MSAFWIPLRAVEARPPEFPLGYLMAVFVGYGDESGKQDDPQSTCSAYAVIVGPRDCWDSFDQAWGEALHRAGIEYFHFKEFGQPDGPYANLDAATERQLFVDLIEAIDAAGLETYATAARHQALSRFKDQTGISLDAYALSLYGCLGYMWSEHAQRDDLALYLDWVENKAHKLACLEDYIATDRTIPALKDWYDGLEIHNAAKPKPGARFSKTPGYQAADFLAWEARKYVHISPEHERQRAEFDGLIRPIDWPPQRRRKSLHSLNAARGILGTFWDVEVLENEHAARGGIWRP